MTNGYDPKFIGDGIEVPLPKFDPKLARSVLRKLGVLRRGIYSDHLHFTIVMNEHTKQLIYSAFNMDQGKLRPLGSKKGKKSWSKDKDIGEENQLGNEFYRDRESRSGRKIPNPYDRGHMVMRHNAMWGDTNAEADKAGKATFIYANSSLQHENLNRDEWRALEEDVVREFSEDANDRLIVFTGPIYGDLDRAVHLSDEKSARVPSGFFKVICYRTKSNRAKQKLGVKAFAIFQDERVLRDRKGAATVKTDRRYQVTISELQDMTGIDFGKELYTRNPLFYHNRKARNEKFNVSSAPERIPIGAFKDVVEEGTDQRSYIEPLSERLIVINAAMINPIGDEAKNEWVSLYNRGSKKITLKDWLMVDGEGRQAKINASIESGDTLRLKGRSKGKLKLANEGGSLLLYDDEGRIIDHVTWSKYDMRRLSEGMAYMFERGQ
ncbi:DNA/RNA non-specific endonuclease [uncultured Tateyamaria sp.]|uniref:DNA/RNA non-specific endonuclease n=1 Tax=uncultured Tateyamaria sp. TaxID=455651 RepID=UPI00262AD373|nr:DNA/RNA non-specific endonuclease [uncultured Tateyamaria sp.]